MDGDPVPVPHFGCALTVQQFHDLASRLKDHKLQFIIHPHLRFQGTSSALLLVVQRKHAFPHPPTHPLVGQPGEQWTMFFKDPSGNSLEFKAMTTPENLFVKYFVQ